MASVTGLTAERMLEIEASSVVGGYIDPFGKLILLTRENQEIDAGVVKGTPGTGISDTTITYQASASSTVAPTGDWLPTPPPVPEGQFLWTRTVLTYSDNTKTTSYSIGKIGTSGANGTPGAPGPAGNTSYLHVAYALNATGTLGFSTTDANGKTYLGTYTDFTLADSLNPNNYKWVLIKGADGSQGPQGVQGPPGADGTSRFTWLKYADTPTTGMSDLPSGKTYMGIAYNKTTSTESSNYADYEWSLIRGADGNQGIQGPPGADGVTTYTWVKYGTSAAGAGMSDDPAGKTYIGLAYNKTTPTESTVASDYQWALLKGADGNGINSTVITYQAGASGTVAPTGTWTSTVPSVAAGQFLWTRTIINFTDGASTTAYSVGRQGVNGADGAAGKGIASSTITYQAGASGTVAPTGTWTGAVPAVAAGQFLWTRTIITFTDATSTTSYSVGRQGVNGADGAAGTPGVGVSSFTRFYFLTSGATPAKPVVISPPLPWTTVEPSYTPGSTDNLYVVERTILTDSSFSYSNVSLSANFEAAKAAYIRANLALDSANGKNKIIFSTSAATGTVGFVAGDIWFQKSGSLIIAQWEFTTAWQPRTLDNAVIANIDAGKITAGFLDVANRIQAGTIAVGKINMDTAFADAFWANTANIGKVTSNMIEATALNGKTITGALIRSVATGARTELTSSGLRVLNAANQELIKLGYGIATGMEVLNPATGTLIPLAQVAFGAKSVSMTNAFNTSYAPNTTYPYDKFAGDTLSLTFIAPSSGGILSWGQTWFFNAGTFGTQSPTLYVQPVINGVPLTATSGGSNFPVFAKDSPVGANVSQLDNWICFPKSTTAFATTPGTEYTITLLWRLVTGAGSASTLGLANRFISFQPTY